MSATARVTVTLEITVPSSWGDDCAVRQIKEQATRSAVASIGHMIRGSQLKAKVVGKPAVDLVIVLDEQKGGA